MKLLYPAFEYFREPLFPPSPLPPPHTHVHKRSNTYVSKKWTAATVSYGVPQPPDRFLHVQYFLITFRKVRWGPRWEGGGEGEGESPVAFRGGGPPTGGLCPHKWLPGSAVAHLPLIPTPRLTFASSFLCSCFPSPLGTPLAVSLFLILASSLLHLFSAPLFSTTLILLYFSPLFLFLFFLVFFVVFLQRTTLSRQTGGTRVHHGPLIYF